MGKFKIKTSKTDRIICDSKNGRLSNGKWAIVWNWGKFEMADKEIAGAMQSNKSFIRESNGIDFEARIPDMPVFMEKAWERDKKDYKQIYQTRWGKKGKYGRGWAVEYGFSAEHKDGFVFLAEDYSNMAIELGENLLFGRDGDSPIYTVEENTVLGVFMPIKP
jgi:hypothetical protein